MAQFLADICVTPPQYSSLGSSLLEAAKVPAIVGERARLAAQLEAIDPGTTDP